MTTTKAPDSFAGLPRTVSPAFLSGDAPIVVLAPHPDDESLACGGLLAAAWQGAGASVICVTDGSASHRRSAQWDREAIAELRASELDAAVAELGGTADDVIRLGATDGMVPDAGPVLNALADRVVERCVASGCRSLFAPSELDPHCDHKATAALGHCVSERLPDLRLLSYPLWARWTDLGEPLTRGAQVLYTLNTQPWREQKQAAISQHRSQLGQVILDDAEGFVLPEPMVELFVTTDELYIETLS